ncbi:MAG: MogA/MoaB family molybdenum cofactor biosynthesis protein [Gemmatimonadaceae bacterium]
MRVAILTVSDSVAAGTRTNVSGEAIVAWCGARGDTVVSQNTTADESAAIAAILVEWCDSAEVDVVFTTGGTGLSPRDVTPEATRAVIEREASGIAEYLRASSFMRFPRAALSRGLAGVRGQSLVLNLPGSPGGVRDALAALEPIIDHAVDVLRGITEHAAGDAGTPS